MVGESGNPNVVAREACSGVRIGCAGRGFARLGR